ncbi:MAG: helicase C-terminal domain-containing protein [Gemmatimonadota bacterium]|jgi:ATP-dependent DNA helicase DinG
MSRVLVFSPESAAAIREEVARARGNEVCFVARVDDVGTVEEPRAVARGHRSAVLAAARDAEPGSLVIHNHPSGALEPSDPDLAIAADLYARGLGLAITDNEARELYVVVEPPDVRGLELLDEGEMDTLLGPDGPVSGEHPAYEDRPTQRDMARAVARAYNQGGVELAEAGTGTGKSLAYLLPAVRWARLNHERTIVSTNTINLQEQLVGKDLPFLRRALGEPFRFALVKGRGNYISIRRAKLAVQSAVVLFDEERRSELDAIAEWLETTRDGSLQDLPFQPSTDVWEEVESDSDACLRARCPHFERCFYQRARRDAASADVLVVNHHLLFSDLAVRRAQGNYTAPAVLPPYRRLVLDEAHNLEDAATSHLGVAVSRRVVFRALHRLDRRGRGLLRAFEERLKAGTADAIRRDALRAITKEIRPDVANARSRANDLFERLAGAVRRADDGVLRLADGFAGEADWVERVQPAFEDLLIVLDRMARRLHGVRETILGDRRWTERLEDQLVELNAVTNRLLAIAEGLRQALSPVEGPVAMVRWLERRGGEKDGHVAACAAPIDLSDLLRESLFEPVDTAILTSATLATRDGFGFLRSRLGLDRGVRVNATVYASPFDFANQVVMALPVDLPAARGNGPAFDDATAAVVQDLAGVSDGGLFVLFTSYRAMRAVAAELRRRGVQGRWPLFVQGEGPRARLLHEFAESGRGILLGVTSFWEGVDVPGDPLRGLVLAKLPFKVPSEPLTAARVEAIERMGGSGFHDYMLPHAVLRLKQGFGRLIRSRSDRGVVVLLDRRVAERGYGSHFLDALPPAPLRMGSWAELNGLLREFYQGALPTTQLSSAD